MVQVTEVLQLTREPGGPTPPGSPGKPGEPCGKMCVSIIVPVQLDGVIKYSRTELLRVSGATHSWTL